MVDARVLGDRFAPITSRMGFVRAPAAAVALTYYEWDHDENSRDTITEVTGGISEAAPLMEPLEFGSPHKFLVVGTANPEWSAFVENGAQGTDPSGSTKVLGQRLNTDSLYITCIPSCPPGDERARLGARQFVVHRPDPDPSAGLAKTIRVIELTQDSRWTFHTSGDPLPFEDVAAYTNRRIADRFTAEMLADYCAAYGLRPFDDDFFPGPSYIIEREQKLSPLARVRPSETFAQAQARLGIMPRDDNQEENKP
ncbi:hypothetical protein [Rathayibacter iranicus]|uniref:Uncharacterized protein n=2 Tax=Rathayibacter iranicus TaxID=59737 RepID=A0AAD1EMU6_9MICO|nr:hypothetical protein [Rathayibacter iranicus]AZZ56488.1 hypothetical protein C7V51_11820 [Rathayibacter iranicus]MWV32548.1 hypothetical protein [Rathayibacter iranicus NCPPB 2253 = VKM Ac-1602]PPI44678.1 hypothetical protein C5E09_10760 [Rathayibacter iranicus]PPI58968.1 hypothetical protein C5E08_11675 [Rathayibacter iranicus]PPI70034.1 hypothetical protein C5E01_10720 [Rathayibacter iranicus]